VGLNIHSLQVRSKNTFDTILQGRFLLVTIHTRHVEILDNMNKRAEIARSLIFIAAVGSTLFLTTDFDFMTRASFLDRVITM
jgi:hypothetical protein